MTLCVRSALHLLAGGKEHGAMQAGLAGAFHTIAGERCRLLPSTGPP
jgi:hypothetical protein